MLLVSDLIAVRADVADLLDFYHLRDVGDGLAGNLALLHHNLFDHLASWWTFLASVDRDLHARAGLAGVLPGRIPLDELLLPDHATERGSDLSYLFLRVSFQLEISCIIEGEIDPAGHVLQVFECLADSLDCLFFYCHDFSFR